MQCMSPETHTPPSSKLLVQVRMPVPGFPLPDELHVNLALSLTLKV